MKTFITFAAAVCLCVGTPSAKKLTIEDLAASLTNESGYKSAVNYEVLLPTSEFPVVYNIRIASDAAADNDTLGMADYLIEWSLEKDGNRSEGFSSYFPGHHYRYRDQRLQEYHAEWDAIPFSPGGKTNVGVQNQAQFCDLLPQFVGRTLKSMQSDTTYEYTVHQDTVISREHVIAIDGTRSFRGIEALEFLYIFDKESLNPKRIEFISNPGQISEQLITAVYDDNKSGDISVARSEEALMSLYPEIFEKYRESSFRLENMPGRRLPSFTAPTTTGERYAHDKGGGFAVPTIIAVLDAEVGSTANTIKKLREAVDALPMQADLILAFVNNKIETIESLTGGIRPGEHLLMSARGLARDCGISSMPVILICDRNATVKDLMIGFNNDIDDFVIQKTALAAGH